MSRAAYIPDFPVVILPQVVMLKGWDSVASTQSVVIAGTAAHGEGVALSEQAHSEGKRQLRVYGYNAEPGTSFFHEFGFGVCSERQSVSAPTKSSGGQTVGCVSRYGSQRRSGIVRKSFTSIDYVMPSFGGYLTQGFSADIFLDFDSQNISVTCSDVVRGVTSADFQMEAGEYSAFAFSTYDYGPETAVVMDFTGETFEPEPGFKVWDAN
ncbi:hypothetical protein [Thalassolituus sp.]|uniref:hypothetical protein n=1 Tax=Thalassolituus sp. TaxID=2030822 RepID=UPI0026099BD5|nr:hypothetical protein [Thalassolituus sp.]